MDKIQRLQSLYELALVSKLVKNKGEFASFIGIDSATLSHALKDDGKVNTDNMITRAEHALMKAGIMIGNSADGDCSVQNFIGNANQIGIPPKNFQLQDKWFALVAEKDRQITKSQEQIDRLLTIIENLEMK